MTRGSCAVYVAPSRCVVCQSFLDNPLAFKMMASTQFQGGWWGQFESKDPAASGAAGVEWARWVVEEVRCSFHHFRCVLCVSDAGLQDLQYSYRFFSSILISHIIVVVVVSPGSLKMFLNWSSVFLIAYCLDGGQGSVAVRWVWYWTWKQCCLSIMQNGIDSQQTWQINIGHSWGKVGHHQQ